jgi:hypothetical protein
MEKIGTNLSKLEGMNLYEMFNDTGAKMVELPSSTLKREYKLLHNMVQNCIFLRKGTKEKVCDIDMLVIYHLDKRVKLNLPYIIVSH